MPMIFNANTLEQREVAGSELDRAIDMGWVRLDAATRLVAIHNPSTKQDKMVLERDVATWLQKGYYAEPTYVYSPEEGAVMVSAEQAKKMLAGKGWYDSPAKFPKGA